MNATSQRRSGVLRRFLLIGLACLTSAWASAGTVETSGHGKTESAAIKEALANAVRQVNGVTIETDTKVKAQVEAIISDIALQYTVTTDDYEHIRAVSRGYVRSYELLESSGTEAPVTVKIRATVLEFDPANPRPGSAKTLVVGNFQVAEGAMQFDGPVQGSNALLANLRSDLESRLVKTRKYLVLTRKDLGPLMEELQFIDSKWVGEPEKVKLRHMYGGDLLVAGKLERLYVHTETKTVKRTGYEVIKKVAEVTLSMTVYNVGSGQIEWTDTYSQSYSWDNQSLDASPEFKDDGNVARAMVLDAADGLTRKLIGRTLQPKVVKIKLDAPAGPVLVLNAGSGVVSMGDQLELVQFGEELIDPDTGQSLGADETFIGMIRISRQDERKSEAVFVEMTPTIQAWISKPDLDLSQLICRPRSDG